MKLIKVGAAVVNQTALDWGGNTRHIRDAIAEARRQDAALLCPTAYRVGVLEGGPRTWSMPCT